MLQDVKIGSPGRSHPGVGDGAPGRAAARPSAALAWAPGALLVVVGPAAAVATALAAGERGNGGWWAFALLVAAWGLGLAAVALATRSRPGVQVALGALVLAVVALVVAAQGLISAAVPLAASDRLAGRGLPATVRYTAMLLVAATAVALAVTLAAVVVARGRKLRLDRRAALAAALAVALGVGAVAAARPLGRDWSDATTERIARTGVDHRQAGLAWARHDVAAAEPAPQPGGTAGWSLLWSAPARAQRQRAFLVNGTDVAVTILGQPQGGETGVAVLDAASGRERWHYRLPDDGVDGVAVSPGSKRVIVLVGDVAVQFDLYSGVVIRRTVLPPDPVDVVPGEAAATWFAIVGAPDFGVDYGGVASSRRDVFAFSSVLLLQQRTLQDGHVAAGKVLALDLDGHSRTIERPPASGCRYSAFYETFGATSVLVRDGVNGSCGPVEVGMLDNSHRTSVFDVDFRSPCDGCQVADPVVDVLPRFGLLLAFRSSREVRTVDEFRLSPPVVLQAAVGPGETATLLPATQTKPIVFPRLVVEVAGQPGYLLDLQGTAQSRVTPLPGSPVRSVVTPGAWYRFAPVDLQTGRVVDVDPRTLTARQPSPSVPCARVRGMSAANGRLLVECESGRLAVFATPHRG